MRSNYSNNKTLLTVSEAANQLACSPGNIRGLMRAGKLKFIRVGCSKGFRIATSEVENYIAENTETCKRSVDRRKTTRFKSRHFGV